MDTRLRFVLVLHNHQPVGNLDHVVERMYQDSYRPLLDVLFDYPALPVNVHISGSLFDWLSARHPDYLDRLGELVAAGRIELLGGAYHDPILPMLPRGDRRGQIKAYGQKLAERFGRAPHGMWLPERIWEPALTADLAAVGIEHTVLDDIHFQRAGLEEDQLNGYYLTEHEGQLMALFAGRERLRYLIPYAEPEETILYLRRIAEQSPGGIVVYADDGEKFGGWPGMHQHVYHERWLRRFFDALAASADWLRVTTLADCIDHVAPLGKIYIPEGSYREMDAWATLGEAKAVEGAPHGTWRNFRVKYPEINEMYCRMLMVSRRLESVAASVDSEDGGRSSCPPSTTRETADQLAQARAALYRAQCGCAYWHGLFGGVCLPHLRQEVYRHLIAADRLLDQAIGRDGAWVTAVTDDFNLDVHKELALANDKLMLLVAPEQGGMLYELDAHEAGSNLLATFTPQPESARVAAFADNTSRTGVPPGPQQRADEVYRRKSLLDHFFDLSTTLSDVASGTAREWGDFVSGRYTPRLRRIDRGVCAELTRRGTALGRDVTVRKQVSLRAGSSVVEVAYLLSGLPPGQPLHFATELNFAGPPLGIADRRLLDDQGVLLGDERGTVDLEERSGVRLVDRHQGLVVRVDVSQRAGFWVFPVISVSGSQQGVESIPQSVVVMPHWVVRADPNGCWTVSLQLAIEAAAQAEPSPLGRQAGVRRARPEGQRLVLDGPHATLAPNLVAPAPWRLQDA